MSMLNRGKFVLDAQTVTLLFKIKIQFLIDALLNEAVVLT